MSSFGRLDVIVLALMLIYVVAVVIHVSWRYYVARHAREIDGPRRRRLAAALNIEVGSLKSIALTAPYLGLAGTCEGILNAFGGGAMQIDAFRVMIATKIAVALVPTVAAIPLALLATSSYNYLRTCIDLPEGQVFDEGQQGVRHFRGSLRFPPTKRFSELPAFGLLAAPVLAIAITGYMTFASFHPPTGLYVELASARCEDYDVVDIHIVLHITEAGKLFLNQEPEDWNSLAERLSQIYSMREDRTLYLLADSSVPFRTVAHALDTVENAPATRGAQAGGMRGNKLGIKIRLITPKVFDVGCPTGSGHLVLS